MWFTCKGKLNVTAKILRQVISCTRDKIVLVSNFTKTLGKFRAMQK